MPLTILPQYKAVCGIGLLMPQLRKKDLSTGLVHVFKA